MKLIQMGGGCEEYGFVIFTFQNYPSPISKKCFLTNKVYLFIFKKKKKKLCPFSYIKQGLIKCLESRNQTQGNEFD